MEINVCPRWLLSQLCVPDRWQLHLGLFFSTILILLSIPLLGYIPHICLMQKVVGLPCPGCGISHSLAALLRLDYRAAWTANPAGLAVAVCFCFQLVARPVAIVAANLEKLVAGTSRFFSNLAVGCLFAIWIIRLF
jgi:hypothetical protein